MQSDLDTQTHQNMDKSMKVEIIIPTLNEEPSIGQLIQRINSLKFPFTISILVIDGGSTDNTIQICHKEQVRLIRQKGKGKGNAMREAVQATDADIVVFIDGDGTYSINDLPSLLEPIFKNKADMVVGSRILGNREKGSISFTNTLGNKIFNKAINSALKSKVTDSLTGFRALRRDVFQDLILFSNSFEIEVEMTVEALSKNYRIVEVPISYKKRNDSETKLNPFNDGVKIGSTLLFVMLNIRPLYFFGIVAVAFFLVGLLLGSALLYDRYIIGNSVYTPHAILVSFLLITGLLSFIIGVLSELVVRSRRRIEFMLKNKI